MAIEDLMAQDAARSMRGMESQNSLLRKLLEAQEETNRLLKNLTEDLMPICRRYNR